VLHDMSGQRMRLEGNGRVTLSFVGVANYIYLVEATLDLMPPVLWTPVSTNTADINGLWQFTDTQATVNVRTHVQNAAEIPRTFAVRTTLLDAQGQAVAWAGRGFGGNGT